MKDLKNVKRNSYEHSKKKCYIANIECLFARDSTEIARKKKNENNQC